MGVGSTAVMREVSRLFREGTYHSVSDDCLLGRFLDEADQDAFAALTARHGPMVLRTCLDASEVASDAEDAFQSTFLTLARKGASIRGTDTLGGWLRRTALRSALAIRKDRQRRLARERVAARAEGFGEDELSRKELSMLVREEVARLPERYRRPVTLCLMEGLPRPEAAGQLSVSEGVLRGRLARARALLRDRLGRRGLRPNQWSLPPFLTLLISTARRVLRPTSIPLVALAACGLIGLVSAPSPSPEPPRAETRPQVPDKNGVETHVISGRVLDPVGRPVAGARIAAFRVLEVLGRAVSEPDGSYRIEAAKPKDRFAPSPSIVATADGFGAAYEQLSKSDDTRLDLKLVPDRVVDGKLVDLRGAPVVGASLKVVAINEPRAGWGPIFNAFKKRDSSPLNFGSGDWKGTFSSAVSDLLPVVTSDADGRFRIRGLGDNRWATVHVSGPGVRPVAVQILSADGVEDLAEEMRTAFPRTRGPDGYFHSPANTPRGVVPPVLVFGPTPRIELERGRTVGGRVREARTGKPIAGLRVAAVDATGQGETAVTDQDGHFRISRVDWGGTLFVHAMSDRPDRYLSAVRRFETAGGHGEVVSDFDIETGVIVTGRVLDTATGKPIVASPRSDCHVEGQMVAGRVEYVPLSSNQMMKSTPTGAFFNGSGAAASQSVSNWIDGEGRFSLAVPPGPGVLLVRAEAGLPMMSKESNHWIERNGFHALFPYKPLSEHSPSLTTRDGTSQEIKARNLFIGKHAFHAINPEREARELAVTIEVPRAEYREVRFVLPGGGKPNGLMVAGLLPPEYPMVLLESDGARAIGVDEPGREVLALTPDGRFHAREVFRPLPVRSDAPQFIRLAPAGRIKGRLVAKETGNPLANHRVDLIYQEISTTKIPVPIVPVTTDADGRFDFAGIIPGRIFSLQFQRVPTPGMIGGFQPSRPENLRRLVFRAGETRDAGEIRIDPTP